MGPAAHPEAMRSHRPSPTRTAPPQRPEKQWSQPRMRSYLLFGLTGILYLLVGLVALRAAWALGAGPEAWANVVADFAHPLYVLFHVLTLVAVVFVGLRFFALFPKAQPPRGLPVKPPPAPVIRALLYGAWGAVTLALIVVLGGIWP